MSYLRLNILIYFEFYLLISFKLYITVDHLGLQIRNVWKKLCVDLTSESGNSRQMADSANSRLIYQNRLFRRAIQKSWWSNNLYRSTEIPWRFWKDYLWTGNGILNDPFTRYGCRIWLFILIYSINSLEFSGHLTSLVSESKVGIILWGNITYSKTNNRRR